MSEAKAVFLSREQIAELTGYKQAPCQIRWLTQNGVRHWVARTGRPVVPRSAIDGIALKSQDDGPQLELGDVA